MLYYSHINEDNNVERQLLQSTGHRTAVVVAGSGERVLALMDVGSCTRFAIVDINEEALFLLQLKLTVLAKAPVEAYLSFIGHHAGSGAFRLALFEEVKGQLARDCRVYWEQRRRSIAKGILFAGHFEKFLEKVRPLVNAFLGAGFGEIFTGVPKAGKFPHWRWKVVIWMFSQQWIYRLLGNKDIAFTGKNAQTSIIPAALDKIIHTGRAPENFIAHLVFKGGLDKMKKEHLPPSLQPGILQVLQERLQTGQVGVDYYLKDILEFIKLFPATEPVFYSLSDILSFQDHEYLHLFFKNIRVAGSLVVGRSFLRNRLPPEELERVATTFGVVENLNDDDTTGMYQVFSVLF